MLDIRGVVRELANGPWYLVVMVTMSVYISAYSICIRKAAMKHTQFGCSYGDIYPIFWERLRRFEIFTILYVMACILIPTLPFIMIFVVGKK